MNETITISKTLFNELLQRISKLERAVFKKSSLQDKVDRYTMEKHEGTLKKLQSADELFTS